MTRAERSLTLRFFIFLLIFSLIAGLFSYFAIQRDASTGSHLPIETVLRPFTVVLDAGHGGEDGGASSKNGILEKDLNLSIAFLLKDMLEANGVTVVMTRTDDRLLYDRNSNYEGRKKALDLAARKKIAEETANSIFVSIHMNAYPAAQYSGLQVWYSPNHPHSKDVADTIQNSVKNSLQPLNERQTKAATSSIFLLHHLQTPAVLVECGFLSNPEEANLLNTKEYQRQLAFSIFLAIMRAQAEENI